MTRVFGVDYRFLACGDVFTQGLVHAAASLGLTYAHADWADPGLLGQIDAFKPDLVFVVHGRKCVRRWRRALEAWPSAVWLLDEPYEVDDTATWSGRFGHVFVNDPATLDRHEHVSYLPVCYDPVVHYPSADPAQRSAVGFIGGGNPTRDRYLGVLADQGLLTYVIGGPWSHAGVQQVCRSTNVPADQTSKLYRSTRIVLNVFRDRHHYNRTQTPATSLNPRIYEALACGALVVSEWRPEIETVVPELPTFHSVSECLETVTYLLSDPDAAERIRVACLARIQPHTYASRLSQVLARCGQAAAA